MEDVLISGKIDAVLDEYPEVNAMALEVQLKMFQVNYKYTTSSEVADIFREMVPEVRHLFKQAEVVLRPLMVVPASTAGVQRQSEVSVP